jgi:hypothetical protein
VDTQGTVPEGNSCPIGVGYVRTKSASVHHDIGNQSLLVPGGRWSLLSFLDIKDSDDGNASRSEVVVLESMLNQYGGKGLNVSVIADSESVSSAIENRSHDWHAENIRFVADPSGKMAQSHSIATKPTTLLISPDGRDVSRWEGFASALELGLKLRSLLGAPPGMAEIQQVGDSNIEGRR